MNNELDATFEDDILPLEEVVINEKKRKLEELTENQTPSKILKLWNIVKSPFHKITIGTLTNENILNISKAEVITEEEILIEPNIDKKCKTNSYNLETEEINKSHTPEEETDIENNISGNVVSKQKFCSIM